MGDTRQDPDLSKLGKTSTKSESASPNRLSLPFPIRLTYAVLGGFATGLFLGLSHGSKTSGLRFRAENAHRLPTTQKGWFLYHKSKNYHMMLGGLKDGFKLGPKLSLWVGSLFALEQIVDQSRSQHGRYQGREDFVSTTVATLTLSGIWSLWYRLPLPTAQRTARIGLYSGLAFGLLQDLAGLARGRRLAYIDFLMGRKADNVDSGVESTKMAPYDTTS